MEYLSSALVGLNKLWKNLVHFSMSDYLLQNTDLDQTADRILKEPSHPGSIDDIRYAIESMAQSTIANQSMHFSEFARITAIRMAATSRFGRNGKTTSISLNY